jgi:hypothetical protein
MSREIVAEAGCARSPKCTRSCVATEEGVEHLTISIEFLYNS